MVNDMPKISVLMITYNRTQYLKKAIESILAQTYKNFELIIVNNGSTDNTKKLCEEYLRKDSRIRLFNLEQHEGISKGRNVAINAVSTEYITIVDDDDYCEKNMLEYLVKLLIENDADISMCGSFNKFEDRVEPNFIFENLLVLERLSALEELLKREKYNVAPPTKLFKKSLFTNLKFPENTLVDDIHVIYKVFANAKTVVIKGIPLYYFRKHEGNNSKFTQTNKWTPDLLEEYLLMHKERTRYLINKEPRIEQQVKYSEWSYMISMCNKIIKYNNVKCKKQYDYMAKILKDNYDNIMKCPYTKEKEVDFMNKHLLD